MRYIIIDTEKASVNYVGRDQVGNVVRLFSEESVLSEEETLSKFKEVFEAGEKRHRDYNHCTEWGFDEDESLSWENFSKIL